MIMTTCRFENLLADSTAQVSRGRRKSRPDVSTKKIFFSESKFSGKFSKIKTFSLLCMIFNRFLYLPFLNFGRVINNSQFLFALSLSFKLPKENATFFLCLKYNSKLNKQTKMMMMQRIRMNLASFMLIQHTMKYDKLDLNNYSSI